MSVFFSSNFIILLFLKVDFYIIINYLIFDKKRMKKEMFFKIYEFFNFEGFFWIFLDLF